MASGSARGPLRLLVGARQPLFARALAGSLRRRVGVEAVEAYPRSTAAAVQAVVIHRPAVALLAWRLEGGTADGTARSLMAAAPDVRVVVWARADDRGHLDQALAAGAAGVVTDEVSLAGLGVVLARVAGGERVVAGDADDPADPDGGGALTVGEIEVVHLLGEGLAAGDIAAEVGATAKTVRTQVTRILTKTGATSRWQAVRLARERGDLG